MSEADNCRKITRPLHTWEAEAARLVFADRMDYAPVRVHECFDLPNRINRIGTKLKKMPAPSAHTHNAITLGNHCLFPINLPDHPVQAGEADHYQLCWLIHELTHVYQYQTMGWGYLVKAVYTQLKEKAQAYGFGGEQGLLQRRQEGWTFQRFNLEQQGDIARGYFERIARGQQDLGVWKEYMEDIWKA